MQRGSSKVLRAFVAFCLVADRYSVTKEEVDRKAGFRERGAEMSRLSSSNQLAKQSSGSYVRWTRRFQVVRVW
jgi:hypothetical protein